jgi:hypothetical protein
MPQIPKGTGVWTRNPNLSEALLRFGVALGRRVGAGSMLLRKQLKDITVVACIYYEVHAHVRYGEVASKESREQYEGPARRKPYHVT